MTIILNGKKYHSENGLLDLVNEHLTTDVLYPPIHLEGKDIEIVLTHTNSKGLDIISFVNGHFTKEGGSHQTAFVRAIVTALKEFYGRGFKEDKCLRGISGAISINILYPAFGNELKSILVSTNMDSEDYSEVNDRAIRTYVTRFIMLNLPIYLVEHPMIAVKIGDKFL